MWSAPAPGVMSFTIEVLTGPWAKLFYRGEDHGQKNCYVINRTFPRTPPGFNCIHRHHIGAGHGKLLLHAASNGNTFGSGYQSGT